MSQDLLEIVDVHKDYGRGAAAPALAGVDITVPRGSTVAVVGESGCGKTTLARCILGAIEPTRGRILFDGADISELRGRARSSVRRAMALVQQNPTTSLDPRMRVADVIAEPLRAHERLDRRELTARVAALADLVSLRRAVLDQRPRELSGGQAQRVAIARAIALSPTLVVLDEPTSALDLSVQAQILNLLLDLQSTLGLTYLLISHDLDVVQHVSDAIVVMYLGQVVEKGAARTIAERPRHPYTAALLSATPAVAPADRVQPIVLPGDIVAADAVDDGCAFRRRCWLWRDLGEPERCRTERPGLAGPLGQRPGTACHFPDRVADLAQVRLTARTPDPPAPHGLPDGHDPGVQAAPDTPLDSTSDPRGAR